MTSTTSASEPTLRRAFWLAAGATTAVVVLWALPGAHGPPADIGGIVDWWSTQGTPGATIAVLRWVGLALATWTLGLAVVGLVAATTHSTLAVRSWVLFAPQSLRRAVAASVLAGMVANPTIVSAAETDPAPVPVLADLGQADNPQPSPAPNPILVDLGPADITGVSTASDAGDSSEPGPIDSAPEPAIDESEQWTVATGDHLWNIARETLVDRGHNPDERDIARYWRQLIMDNAEAIGGDVDLIYPGTKLVLPQ